MQGWNGCARAGALHLLSIDADVDLDALKKEVYRLPLYLCDHVTMNAHTDGMFD